MARPESRDGSSTASDEGYRRWTLRIGQDGRDTGQGLLFLRIKDMEDGPNQKAMAGLFPVATVFESAFGIDEDVGDVLDVTDFV